MRKRHAGVFVGRVTNRTRTCDRAAGGSQVDVGARAGCACGFDGGSIGNRVIGANVDGGGSAAACNGARSRQVDARGVGGPVALDVDVTGGCDVGVGGNGCGRSVRAGTRSNYTCAGVDRAVGVIQRDIRTRNRRIVGDVAARGLDEQTRPTCHGGAGIHSRRAVGLQIKIARRSRGGQRRTHRQIACGRTAYFGGACGDAVQLGI